MNDVFAEIGTLSIDARRKQLAELKPQVLPRKVLEAAKPDASAAFCPADKIDTPEKLSAELARQRRRYAPFLLDLAPELPSLRMSSRLGTFQWRLETETDRTDASHAQSGAGDWTQVSVPHFGGPIGRGVAYYRTSFEVTRAMLDKGAVFVRFGAVDYKAHVFVNGHFLGAHEGFFSPFEFECAAAVREGTNVLLVKVENDAVYMSNNAWGQNEEGDKLYGATNLGWDDPEMGWCHCPPGFGIYQDVFIEARAPLHVSDIFVRPLPDQERAEAWIEVWSKNREYCPVSFEISLYGQNFRKTVIKSLRYTPGTTIIPGVGDLQKPTDNQKVLLAMGPGTNVVKVPLSIPNPRWWDLESPWLYQIQVRLLDETGRVLDGAKRQFGMRTFRQDTVSDTRGRMFLNNREIRLRGANTMGFEQQDVFKKDFRQLEDDILLAKICHMNYLRFTQRPVQPEVYDMCDRLGLMTQSDLPLFGCMRFNKVAEAIRQVEEMEHMVRSHPCSIMITYINEPFPNANGKPHRHLDRGGLQAFFDAADLTVRLVNPDRVIKHVDGDYDPPSKTLPDNHCYCGWYNGHGLELGRLHRGYWMPINKGWFYGCGEFGSEGIDPEDLMRRRYPKSWVPAPGEDESAWNPDRVHGSQTGKYHYLWFDTQTSMADWVRVSQRHQAWATRLFTERFRRDNRMVSFAIHLFIDAFPASWMKAIMDCDRRPKPAFFAYRDALEPLTVSIRTDRWAYTAGEAMPFEFWVSNDTHEVRKDLTLCWLIEQNGKGVFAQKGKATVESLKSTFQGHFVPRAPQVTERSRFTVRLALCDGKKVLRDVAVDYDVFPALPVPAGLAVEAVGNGKARALLRELGVKPATRKPAVILVDDFAAFKRSKIRLERAVADGARVVFLELPVGEYEIGGSTVRILDCVMRPREFVSCATGHDMVQGFQSEDFKCWYDPRAGYFRPILATLFQAQGWQAVLTNGNGVWGGGAWQRMMASAERKDGKGGWHICQVELAGRVKTSPVAARFARRLLGEGL